MWGGERGGTYPRGDREGRVTRATARVAPTIYGVASRLLYDRGDCKDRYGNVTFLLYFYDMGDFK